MVKALCLYFKFGYCKFLDNCRNRHVDVLCESENCPVYSCEKRHPKGCSYQRDYGTCKYLTYCKYDHRKPLYVRENGARLEEMEKKIEKIDDEESKKKIDKLDKQVLKLVGFDRYRVFIPIPIPIPGTDI